MKPSRDIEVKHHLLSKLHMVRQMYMDNILQVQYLSTDDMIANFLTKP